MRLGSFCEIFPLDQSALTSDNVKIESPALKVERKAQKSNLVRERSSNFVGGLKKH